jgi:hypothetical protein
MKAVLQRRARLFVHRWVRWVEAQRPKERVSVLTGVSPSLAEGEWRRQGAGIVMEGWTCTAPCLAYLGTVTQQV